MHVQVLHSSLIYDFSGILKRLLNLVRILQFLQMSQDLCFLLHHFFPAVGLLSANSLSPQSALTWPGLPFSPSWQQEQHCCPDRSQQPGFSCWFVIFQLTAILSQSGEITLTPHTCWCTSFRQRIPVVSEAANQHLVSNGDGLDLPNRCFIFA